jgi:hypothetical protein
MANPWRPYRPIAGLSTSFRQWTLPKTTTVPPSCRRRPPTSCAIMAGGSKGSNCAMQEWRIGAASHAGQRQRIQRLAGNGHRIPSCDRPSHLRHGPCRQRPRSYRRRSRIGQAPYCQGAILAGKSRKKGLEYCRLHRLFSNRGNQRAEPINAPVLSTYLLRQATVAACRCLHVLSGRAMPVSAAPT